MTAVTGYNVDALALTVHDGVLFTSPPTIAVSARTATDESGLVMRFRHRGLGLVVTELGSGIAVAWSTPTNAHQHTIRHRGHEWQLHLERSRLAADRPTRRGLVLCTDDGAASIESTYLHYVSEWRDHRRLHRAWTTGSLNVEDAVPGPVIALALRLTLGRRWFEHTTGTWVETRREWDFGGF